MTIISTDQPVVLFASPACDYCAAVRAFFAGRHVAYVEYDVTRDDDAIRRLIWLTGRALVPTILIGDTALVGFDADRLTELLDAPAEEPPEELDDDAEFDDAD